MSAPPRLLDLRGLRCPWPAIRAARAIREASGGGELLIAADDPAAADEIRAVATERGWQFFAENGESGPVLRLRSR